ncbi:hypothetical protein BD626DRAFT_574253 [Schizophyllum amplum]|uniref:Uncharacterized protein n=1 Tax=Schizophyllum amplum TaxID=97359 RepID=A0A550BZ00_9AGAR|nr:hypothetical protein BD626DRAFT_574253 [Auriculariopsis ampla]
MAGLTDVSRWRAVCLVYGSFGDSLTTWSAAQLQLLQGARPKGVCLNLGEYHAQHFQNFAQSLWQLPLSQCGRLHLNQTRGFDTTCAARPFATLLGGFHHLSVLVISFPHRCAASLLRILRAVAGCPLVSVTFSDNELSMMLFGDEDCDDVADAQPVRLRRLRSLVITATPRVLGKLLPMCKTPALENLAIGTNDISPPWDGFDDALIGWGTTVSGLRSLSLIGTQVSQCTLVALLRKLVLLETLRVTNYAWPGDGSSSDDSDNEDDFEEAWGDADGSTRGFSHCYPCRAMFFHLLARDFSFLPNLAELFLGGGSWWMSENALERRALAALHGGKACTVHAVPRFCVDHWHLMMAPVKGRCDDGGGELKPTVVRWDGDAAHAATCRACVANKTAQWWQKYKVGPSAYAGMGWAEYFANM